MKKKIFISYGRKPQKYVDFIMRIKDDLESKGFQVWLDTENIRIKSDWEHMLEDALSSNDEVVFFMTEHAVRRPNGFCLNEISYAILENKPIIPVMLEMVTPPLSICRLQWIDMINIWDKDADEFNEELYQIYLQKLIAILEENNKLIETSSNHSLVKLLEPQNFDLDIVKQTKKFIGREWIYSKILTWLNDSKASSVLWITAKAGYGKTAIVANAIHILPNIAGVFFCQYDSVLRRSPLELIKTFAYHMSTQLPNYKREIEKISNDEYQKYSKNLKDFFQKIILEPMNKIEVPPNNHIYIIDGLDEIEDEKFGIIHLIANEFEKLPKWLRLLIVSRPEPNLKIALSKFSPMVLDTRDTDANSKDIEKIITKELGDIESNMLRVLVKKSQNNMLYINEVLSAIKNGSVSVEEIDTFPNELSGVYEQYFLRQFPDIKEYEENQEKVFQLMVATRTSLPLKYLREILGWNKKKMKRVKDSIGSLIYINNEKVEFFHKTLYDWLIDEEQCSEDYFVDDEEGIEQILNWIFSKYNTTHHIFIQELYKNFYYFNSREVSFEIIEFLINENYAEFDDILNYISMSKGDSKWNQAIEVINKYLENNDFNEMQTAYFYYTIGRVYVDDLKNFEKAEQYLNSSIEIYQGYPNQVKIYIVSNTLSIYYFSKGDYKKAKNILAPIYEKVLRNEQSIFDESMIEVIHSNYMVYHKVSVENEEIEERVNFINMEVKCYYFNNQAIMEVSRGNIDNAKRLFEIALYTADKYQKYYAKAAILYNKSLLFNNQELFYEARNIVDSNQYSIGSYILDNFDSPEHILNTFKINKKNYWICIKNIDLLI